MKILWLVSMYLYISGNKKHFYEENIGEMTGPFSSPYNYFCATHDHYSSEKGQYSLRGWEVMAI